MAESRPEEGKPQETRRKVSVPKMRTTLKQIGDDLTKEELEKLIYMAGNEIPKSKTEHMKALDFFSALEERQLINTKEDDVDYLVELLIHLPRLDLVKKLTYTRSNYTVASRIQKFTDGVMVTKTNTVEVTSCSVKENNGAVLHDPSLLRSACHKCHHTIVALESMMQERDKAVASNMELKKRVNVLQVEIEQVRDDQNNLIWERNNALGAKSEYVFQASEMRKELSDLKRANSLLEKTCTDSNNMLELRNKEISELKKTLSEATENIECLKSKVKAEEQAKNSALEELAKLQKVEGDNGRVTCKRCGLVYVEANNPVDACRYHPGHFDCVGAIKKKMEWSCCKNTNKNAPGCCKKKHLTIDYPSSGLSPGGQGRKFTM